MKAVPGILPTLLEMIYFFSTPTIDVEPKKEKTSKPLRFQGFCGAARQIRTADLILTKDALYRLSYSSKLYGDSEGT